jgi:hypothetical protein
MDAKKSKLFLQTLGACTEAVEWADGKNLAEAWGSCGRADWMLWLSGRMAGRKGWPTRKQIVLVACDCADTTLHLFEKKCPADKRPRIAIEKARAWAEGLASIADVRSASFAAAAFAASSAASSAAFAAFAAASSASSASASAAAFAAAAFAASAASFAASAASFAAAAAAFAASAASFAASSAASSASSAAFAASSAASSAAFAAKRKEKLKEFANLVRQKLFIPSARKIA